MNGSHTGSDAPRAVATAAPSGRQQAGALDGSAQVGGQHDSRMSESDLLDATGIDAGLSIATPASGSHPEWASTSGFMQRGAAEDASVCSSRKGSGHVSSQHGAYLEDI